MHRVRMWMTDGIEPGLPIEPDRIYHQRVAIPLADGIPKPGWFEVLRVLAAHRHHMEPGVLFKQLGQVLIVLNDLDGIPADIHRSHQAKRQTMPGVIEFRNIIILEVLSARGSEWKLASPLLLFAVFGHFGNVR